MTQVPNFQTKVGRFTKGHYITPAVAVALNLFNMLPY